MKEDLSAKAQKFSIWSQTTGNSTYQHSQLSSACTESRNDGEAGGRRRFLTLTMWDHAVRSECGSRPHVAYSRLFRRLYGGRFGQRRRNHGFKATTSLSCSLTYCRLHSTETYQTSFVEVVPTSKLTSSEVRQMNEPKGGLTDETFRREREGSPTSPTFREQTICATFRFSNFRPSSCCSRASRFRDTVRPRSTLEARAVERTVTVRAYVETGIENSAVLWIDQ